MNPLLNDHQKKPFSADPKLTIQPENFYQLLYSERVPPKSSQPDLPGVEALFSFLGSHYDSILVLTVSEKMSGFFSACRLAAERIPGLQLTVIDSKALSAQLGLLLKRTAEAVESGTGYEDLVRLCGEWSDKTELIVDVNSVKAMVRSGRLSRMKGFLANAFNLKPIVSVSGDGRAVASGKSFSRRANLKKIIRKIKTTCRGRGLYAYAVVHVRNEDRARTYADLLTEALGRPPEFIMSASPVIGVHAGIGSVAVALAYQN